MSYDKNGNIHSDGARTFTYSSYDLVTNITQGNESSSFKYDSARQRYERYDVKLEDGVLAYYTTYYVDGARNAFSCRASSPSSSCSLNTRVQAMLLTSNRLNSAAPLVCCHCSS